MTDKHVTKIAHELFFGKLAMHNFMHDLISEHMSPMITHGENLHIELYITHSTTVLHGENDLTMILARSSQEIANSHDHKEDPPVWDLSVIFYIGATQT